VTGYGYSEGYEIRNGRGGGGVEVRPVPNTVPILLLMQYLILLLMRRRTYTLEELLKSLRPCSTKQASSLIYIYREREREREVEREKGERERRERDMERNRSLLDT
jgi:hypothetical protein